MIRHITHFTDICMHHLTAINQQVIIEDIRAVDLLIF